MSDQDQSGASAPAPAPAPAASGAAPAATQPFGTFGTTRGSGLNRGKRVTPPAAPAAGSAASSGFKPSALEVITSKSEYVNPFTGETTVSAPVVNEPAPQAAPVITPPAPAPVIAVAPAPVAAPVAAPATAQTTDLFPFGDEKRNEDAPKPALNILPPQGGEKRVAVNWEAPSAAAGDAAAQPSRREDRPTFRTERGRRSDSDNRDTRPADARPADTREPKPFDPGAPREPRRDDRTFEPRSNQPYQDRGGRSGRSERADRSDRPALREEPAPVKKSGGFFGWLKRLFGGKKAPAAPASGDGREPRREGEYGGDGRNRGGRGRGRDRGGNRTPRDPNFQHPDPRDEVGPSDGGGDSSRREYRGEGRPDGGGRRGRRGGRGRSRGDEGGGGNDRGPRPEGQQGGGAI
ncbi:MAG: translation initiation factor IF-2 [Opitutaceae bacterium]